MIGKNELIDDSDFLRRSNRNPHISMLDRRDVRDLITKIKEDHVDTIVLKIKHHIHADINMVVFDKIIEALWENKVCQALYIQNISKAIGDKQIDNLIALLRKKKKIWGLNIGENYEISTSKWIHFCNKLPETNITHIYVSEHVIPIDLKNKMRFYIRENRKKHNLHCSMKNLEVIEKCTHMWWNPINGVKELKPQPVVEEKKEEVKPEDVVVELTPNHVAYWQEGYGKGGDTPWKFKCLCGEVCSSYENYRYHPTGKMFECSHCKFWSHVTCVLGNDITDDDLEEMSNVLCGSCYSKFSRSMRRSGTQQGQMEFSYHPSKQIIKSKNYEEESGVQNKKSEKKNREVEEEPEEEWKFKCRCGEVCSSYENPKNHPSGLIYQCSKCSIWSHAKCNYGEKITPEDIEKIEDALCFSCKSKRRRLSRLETPSIEVNIN